MKAVIKLFIASLFLASCVQETHLKTINFEVDMRNVENPSYVGVRGYFTSPSWSKTLTLSDGNNDGIYTGVVKHQSAQFGTEFKFVNNDSIYELEDKDNRFIKYEYQPETITYKAVFNDEKRIEIIKE